MTACCCATCSTPRDTQAFIANRSRDDLSADRLFALALVKAVEIVGEAAWKVSESTQNRMPEIPWAKIIGMRHRLVHAYSLVDYDLLWQVVTTQIPTLIAQLEKSLDL